MEKRTTIPNYQSIRNKYETANRKEFREKVKLCFEKIQSKVVAGKKNASKNITFSKTRFVSPNSKRAHFQMLLSGKPVAEVLLSSGTLWVSYENPHTKVPESKISEAVATLRKRIR